jgi:hypothetical protein
MNNEEKKPLKRHESMVPLSQDHHFGLLFCWKLRQGIRKGVSVERIQGYVQYFLTHQLDPHFMEEENLLFRDANDSLCQRAQAEHRLIRTAAETVIETGTEISITILADALSEHIRFEERILFAHLENKFTPEELAVIGADLKEQHAGQEKDQYSDEFWI